MRIVSWNFLEGGLQPAIDGSRTPFPARRAAAQALIQRLNPDVLILNEALYAEPFEGHHEDYAAIFGFPYAVAHLYDRAWGNVILSRFPITKSQKRLIHPKGGQQNRGWLAARIQGIWISTYHPHPQRRPFKRSEDVIRFLKRVLDGPAVLCGDLNAISPEDAPDRGELIESFKAFQSPEYAELSVDRFILAGHKLFDEVLPHMGWRDAVPPEGRHSSMPTALIRKPNDRGMRIDHALVSREVVTTNAWIELAPEADIASDHYPVVLDIA